jgi:hypothetical protein
MNEIAGTELYNKLLQTFAEEGNAELMDYNPAYYGGAYLDEEKNLVIRTKNVTSEQMSYLKNILI